MPRGPATLCVLAALSAATVSPAAQVTVDAGPQLEYVRYEEPGVMEEAGFLGGLFAEATAYRDEWMLCGFLSYVGGYLYYDDHPNTGQDIDGYTPNTILDVHCIGGHRTAVAKCAVTPYAGLGFRLLVDDLPDLDGATGYRREQTYTYVPLGFESSLVLQNGWTSVYRIEYDLLLEGRNRSAGERMTQDTGFGLRLSASFASPAVAPGPPRSFALSICPFIQYWDIGDSSLSEHSFYEPGNRSTMLGVRLAARF